MASILAFFAASVSAHAVMNTPNGFPGLKVQSSPLGVGVQFPCQFGPGATYDFSNSTKVVAGGKTLLSLTGSAVHGGGSCQVSISKTASAKPEDWRVIHTMIGGCPATITTSAGNLETVGTQNGYPEGKQCAQPDSDETDCVKSYNIQVPKEIASGKYFFSWTWFNKVGNREIYQNCAPIEVTGGASNDDYFNNLPSIFYANDGQGSCSTHDLGPTGNVVDIPFPGSSVTRSTNPNDSTSPGVAGAECIAQASAQQKATNGNSVQAVQGGADSGSSPSLPASDKPASSATPVQVATSTSINVVTSTLIVQPAATPLASAPAGSLGQPSNSSAAGTVACKYPCTTDGAMMCIPPDHFGICDHGCAVAMPLAPGTHCTDGKILKRARSIDSVHQPWRLNVHHRIV